MDHEDVAAQWTRPLPRFDPLPGQPDERVLWLQKRTGSQPQWTYNPDRRAGDVVPEVVKVLLSELRPTQGDAEGPTIRGRHRARRRRWWERSGPITGGTMQFVG